MSRYRYIWYKNKLESKFPVYSTNFVFLKIESNLAPFYIEKIIFLHYKKKIVAYPSWKKSSIKTKVINHGYVNSKK